MLFKNKDRPRSPSMLNCFDPVEIFYETELIIVNQAITKLVCSNSSLFPKAFDIDRTKKLSYVNKIN